MGHGEVEHRFTGVDGILVILAQATIFVEPAERAFDNPAFGDDAEPRAVIRSFHNREREVVVAAHPMDEFPGVATVGPDDAQPLEPMLGLPEHQFGAIAILDISSVDHDRQEQSEGIDEDVTLSSLHLFPSIKATNPPFSAVFTD